MTTDVTTAKELLGIYHPGSAHMVGDGFPVRNLFPSNDLDRSVDPFLMLDYAGPQHFPATDHPRGVGEHPHRGFETVTIMYNGAVAHRDSAGNAGVIGPGDVQWMTAASGVVHEELHETQWAKQGGTFQAIQLWVNLPQAQKMSAPRYQTLLDADIPAVNLEHGAGRLRVIAGTFQGQKGPARTFTPVELYDLQLQAGGRVELTLPDGQSTSVFVLQGGVSVNGAKPAGEAELVVLKRQGSFVVLEAKQHSRIFVMSGSLTIDIYSDVVCPWCYVGKRRLERALSQLPTVARQVTWRPFQLNPAMPAEGMDRTAYLEAKFGSLDAFRRLEEQVTAAGAAERIPFAFEKIIKTPNTFLAHRLIWHAAQQGRQDAVVDALFRGYFEQGADIGLPSVLTSLAESAGLDAAHFLATDEGAADVKAEEAAGHQLGIRAVPYFVMNNRYGISGAQQVDVFVGAMEKIHSQQAEDLLSRK